MGFFFWTVAQFATLRENLALLHHWVFEVGFTRARLHPLHVDKNKTRLSMMGAVSQHLYMDRKHELSPEGTSNDSSFPLPSCHPGSRCGDLKHPNVQHGHKAATVRAQAEEQEWAAEARMRAGKSRSADASVSKHVGFSDKTTSLVPPPASVLLLRHAGVHGSLLPAKLLSSLLCKLHHWKHKH